MYEPIAIVYPETPPSGCPWVVERKERGRWHGVGKRRGVVTFYADEADAKRAIRRRRSRGQTVRLGLVDENGGA